MAPQVSFNRLELDDEMRLRDLIVESSHNIEPELRVIGGRLPIGDSCTLDMIAVDGQSRLALLEARCSESAEWLLEAIDHYDWVRSHSDEVVLLFPQHSIDTSRLPRIMMICSSFSEAFRHRLVHLESLPLELLAYRYLEVNGVRGLYFEPVPIPKAPRVLDPAPLQEHLDRVSDAERAVLAGRLVARTAALDPGVRLIVHRAGAIALWHERLLARFEFSRAGAWVSDETGGEGTDLHRFQDLEQVLAALTARVTLWKRTASPAPSRPAARSGSGRDRRRGTPRAAAEGSTQSHRPRGTKTAPGLPPGHTASARSGEKEGVPPAPPEELQPPSIPEETIKAPVESGEDQLSEEEAGDGWPVNRSAKLR